MGSVVVYRCSACNFSTDKLSVGWGKAGRGEFWGALAVCAACRQVIAVNLAEKVADRSDRRCTQCNAPVKLIEGTVERVPCPQCGKALGHETVGVWS
jgi:predicted RNA-binding Zn-ribbon protein involved in translation (DUF1610 family)